MMLLVNKSLSLPMLIYRYEDYPFQIAAKLLIGQQVKKCMATALSYSVNACITHNELSNTDFGDDQQLWCYYLHYTQQIISYWLLCN